MEINKIYNENCLDTMKRMEDNFIDLTVASPPYDGLRKYTGEAEWNFEVFQEIAKELYRVTKQGGVVVWIVGDATIKGSETGTSFKQALYFKEIGFNLHDTMIYKRRGIPLNHNRYEQHFEYIFVLSKGRPKTFNPILQENILRKSCKNEGFHNQLDGSKKKISAPRKTHSIIGNVFEYNVGYMNSTKDKIAFKHPASFPEKLCADQMLSWSNEGDIVYDCFAGSGTTGIKSYELCRNFILTEISEEYCNIIKERFNKRFDKEIKICTIKE